MSDQKRVPRIFLVAVGALVVAAAAVLSGRRSPPPTVEEPLSHHPPMLEPATDPPPAPRPRPSRRFAVASAFTVLFFAGASFSAVAGDQLVGLPEEDGAAELAAAEPAPAPEPTPAAERAPEPEPRVAPEPTPVPEAAPDTEPAAAPEPESQPATAPEPAAATGRDSDRTTATAATRVAAAAPRTSAAAAIRSSAAATPTAPALSVRATAQPKPFVQPAPTPTPSGSPVTPEPERVHGHEHELGATVWLNRALPDPTPASARLTRTFAHSLAAKARVHGTSWPAVLGVLRAQGKLGAQPASPQELDRLGGRLDRDVWRDALALSGDTSFADRAEAFAAFYRAVGVESLITGLEASKPRLVRRLLADTRVTIYPGGRADLEAGRVDVRIVVLVSYLAERHGSLTVSSLRSGHRTFSRPGVVSAHVYGHAVDIAAVGGRSILGNSQAGGITEDAVRSILLLPAELQPRQVISLLGLGGASFPLADHADHIHVGY